MVSIWPFLAAAAENPWEKQLPFAAASIHYQLSGSQEGTEDRYFRDHGRETATYRKAVTVMMGMKMVHDTVEIQDADWTYTYDLQEKTGTKSTNPLNYMTEEYNKLTAAEKEQVRRNAETMGASFMQGMNGKVEENVTTILGQSCDRTSMMGTTVYMIHGTAIPLKTETAMAGMKMASVATSFDEGNVDDRFFQHPAGIEVVHDREADEMARNMAAQTMAMLKDPGGMKNVQPGAMMPGMGAGEGSEADQEMMDQAGEIMKGMRGK
jgi:hypothetical protein